MPGGKIASFAIYAFILFEFTILNVESLRVSQMIYYDVPNGNYTVCFRRLNATHQTGCSSDRGGNVGTVHLVANDKDVTWLVDKGPHSPYIVLLTPTMFMKDPILKLVDSKKINGMMVIEGNMSLYKMPDHFSPDKTCPNSDFDAYADSSKYSHCNNLTWNELANEFLFRDFNMPISVLKNASNIEFLITECYEKYNKPLEDGSARSHPLCSARMFAPMDAAKDTPTCMRRSQLITNLNPQSYCDPIQNYNIYSLLEAVNSSQPIKNDSVTVIAARMDGFSMFYGDTPSADSSVSGMVTLLAVAEALGRFKEDMMPYLQRNPVLFSLFNGEAFDNSGSHRMVWEMLHGFFPSYISPGDFGPSPIGLHSLKQYIELNQVGPQEGSKLWIHSDPLSSKNTGVADLVRDLKAAGDEVGLSLEDTPDWQPLPPASFQSFLSERNMTGIVVTNHDSTYTNKYYNSHMDLPHKIGVKYRPGISPEEKYDFVTEGAEALTKLATTLARFVYKEVTGNASEDINASNKTVTNLLYCYLVDSKCELFNFSLDSANARNLKSTEQNPISNYVGVSRSAGMYSTIARNLLMYYTGDKLTDNKTECAKKTNSLYKYIYVQGDFNASDPQHSRLGLCLQGTANFSSSLSPAFEQGYDWLSNKYPAWSESVWTSFKIQIFLIPSHSYEVAVLCVGLFLFLAGLVMIFFIDRNAFIMFQPEHSRMN